MFATDRAVGPDSTYDEVKVYAAVSTSSPHERLCADCIAWLRQETAAGTSKKKCALHALLLLFVSLMIAMAQALSQPSFEKCSAIEDLPTALPVMNLFETNI
jgi:hypothetical protein